MKEQNRLTINEMLEIEPSLQVAITYVERANLHAKHSVVYWHEVWKECKRLIDVMIGFYARNKQLESRECWDDFHEHLKSLAINCV